MKRNKYFVDKKFQSNMVARVIVFIVAAVVISGVLSYTVAMQIEKKSPVQLYGATDSFGDDIKTVTRIDVVKPVVLRASLVGGMMAMLMAGISMFFYSHRLAGPVFRLKRHLNGMIEGNYGDFLRFRKKDEFGEIADIINKLQEKLNSKRDESHD